MSIERILAPVGVPDVVRVEQRFPRPVLADVAGELRERLRASGVLRGLEPGQRVALGVGSRGVSDLPLLVRTLVEEVGRASARPFVVPSMGSHGGATAAGQVEVLASLGVTEASVGAPIEATMEVREIGRTDDGLPVYLDAYAHEADAILVLNAIKPHVAFRGRYESGLVKMLAIGLGKQHGADACHDRGFGHMAENIVASARVTLARARVLGAVGVVANAYSELCQIAVVPAAAILKEEPALLDRARELAPRLPFDELDVLVVDRIGKDIAGTGLDTNVIGRYHTPYASGGPRIARIAVLDLSERSGGNAHGIGLADVTTRRAFAKIRFDRTYPNSLTSTQPATAKIPMVLEHDRQAIQAAIKTSNVLDKQRVRLVRIASTKELERLEVSTSLLDEVAQHPHLSVQGEPYALPFDTGGRLF